MKPYDELTLEEKQELIRYALKMKEQGHPGFCESERYETVVLNALGQYEFWRTGHMITPLREHQRDIINISHSMPEYSLYVQQAVLDP